MSVSVQQLTREVRMPGGQLGYCPYLGQSLARNLATLIKQSTWKKAAQVRPEWGL